MRNSSLVAVKNDLRASRIKDRKLKTIPLFSCQLTSLVKTHIKDLECTTSPWKET